MLLLALAGHAFEIWSHDSACSEEHLVAYPRLRAKAKAYAALAALDADGGGCARII
jgi:hypothetical protein